MFINIDEVRKANNDMGTYKSMIDFAFSEMNEDFDYLYNHIGATNPRNSLGALKSKVMELRTSINRNLSSLSEFVENQMRSYSVAINEIEDKAFKVEKQMQQLTDRIHAINNSSLNISASNPKVSTIPEHYAGAQATPQVSVFSPDENSAMMQQKLNAEKAAMMQEKLNAKEPNMMQEKLNAEKARF